VHQCSKEDDFGDDQCQVSPTTTPTFTVFFISYRTTCSMPLPSFLENVVYSVIVGFKIRAKICQALLASYLFIPQETTRNNLFLLVPNST